MTSLDSWSRFLALQSERPSLEYVHGMRHPVAGGSSCDLHDHPEFEIVYHPQGRGVTTLRDGTELPFKEGGVVVYAPRTGHNQEMTETGEDLCVKIAAPTLEKLPSGALYLPHFESRSMREELHLLSLGLPRLTKTEQMLFNLRATALLLELIHLACFRRDQAEASPAEQHVLRAEQFIRERFADIRSLDEVAAYLGVTHDHLRHVFKELRGKPLIRHLNVVRIERAETLLRHSRLPLKQIATLCGFKDEYYFSAVFRQFTQQSPGDFRRGL
jgi:AraC-like DNA-binding protein